MSLDRVRPQSFAPVRLEKGEVEHFFRLLRERKIVRGETSSLRLSDKPFAPKIQEAREANLPSHTTKKGGKQGKKSKTKKLEASLQSARL